MKGVHSEKAKQLKALQSEHSHGLYCRLGNKQWVHTRNQEEKQLGHQAAHLSARIPSCVKTTYGRRSQGIAFFQTPTHTTKQGRGRLILSQKGIFKSSFSHIYSHLRCLVTLVPSTGDTAQGKNHACFCEDLQEVQGVPAGQAANQNKSLTPKGWRC